MLNADLSGIYAFSWEQSAIRRNLTKPKLLVPIYSRFNPQLYHIIHPHTLMTQFNTALGINREQSKDEIETKLGPLEAEPKICL